MSNIKLMSPVTKGEIRRLFPRDSSEATRAQDSRLVISMILSEDNGGLSRAVERLSYLDAPPQTMKNFVSRFCLLIPQYPIPYRSDDAILISEKLTKDQILTVRSLLESIVLQRPETAIQYEAAKALLAGWGPDSSVATRFMKGLREFTWPPIKTDEERSLEQKLIVTFPAKLFVCESLDDESVRWAGISDDLVDLIIDLRNCDWWTVHPFLVNLHMERFPSITPSARTSFTAMLLRTELHSLSNLSSSPKAKEGEFALDYNGSTLTFEYIVANPSCLLSRSISLDKDRTEGNRFIDYLTGAQRIILDQILGLVIQRTSDLIWEPDLNDILTTRQLLMSGM